MSAESSPSKPNSPSEEAKAEVDAILPCGGTVYAAVYAAEGTAAIAAFVMAREKIALAIDAHRDLNAMLEGKRHVAKLQGTPAEAKEKELLAHIRGDAPLKHLLLSLLYDLDLLPEQIKDKSGSQWWRMLTTISHVVSATDAHRERLKEAEKIVEAWLEREFNIGGEENPCWCVSEDKTDTCEFCLSRAFLTHQKGQSK